MNDHTHNPIEPQTINEHSFDMAIQNQKYLTQYKENTPRNNMATFTPLPRQHYNIATTTLQRCHSNITTLPWKQNKEGQKYRIVK